MKIQVFKKHTQRLRYEARFWACRMSAGWFCPRSDFYRLFEASLKLHLYLRASVLANLAARRRPGDADVQSMQCTLAFRSGQLDQAFSLLVPRLQDGDYRAVERLLFRTGSRPQDVHDRLVALVCQNADRLSNASETSQHVNSAELIKISNQQFS